MKFKRLSVLTLLLIFLLNCSGCGKSEQQTEEKFIGTEIEKQAAESIDGVRLRDNNLLYENQNPTEIVTMYLTVSTGNSSENTDHTWKEINT
ncbi:MAG: spore coat protein CotH, partial [Clostridia bacterium]|nr:spore coat protein CotH [Clostridia bacterium]